MKKIIFIGLFIALFLLSPIHLYAFEATHNSNVSDGIVELSPVLKILSDNKMILDIYVEPNGQAINVVALYFNYATSSVIKEIILEESFCNIFISSKFDNQEGRAEILCGLPNPGVNQRSLIGSFEIETRDNSKATFEIDSNSLVLANDGKGTNVLNKINKLDSLIE